MVSVTSPWTPVRSLWLGSSRHFRLIIEWGHRVGLSFKNLILKIYRSRVNDRRSLWGKLLSSIISYHRWLGSVWTYRWLDRWLAPCRRNPCRRRVDAIFKFSRRLKLRDFLWFTRNSWAAGGPHSLISSCGRDLINELDG